MTARRNADAGAEVRRFSMAVDAWTKASFASVAQAAKDSVVEGSPITGAPGQPVQTGRLKTSWILEFASPYTALISTNVIYANFIETGISWRGRPMTLRSAVGGFHSVSLTVSNFDRLAAAVIRSAGGQP